MRDQSDLFEVLVRCDGDGTIVAPVGEIDLATADAFRMAVDAAVDTARRVEIDLSDTTFLDSTGLSVLAGAYRRAAGDVRVTLSNPTPMVGKVLAVSGVGQLFERNRSAAESVMRP